MPLPTALGPAGRGNAPNRPVQAPLAASTSQAGPVRHRGRFQRRGIFKADLPDLMYAFGDEQVVALESVNVLEELLVDYITDICLEAHKVSTNKTKIKLDDFRFALRHPHQRKQLARLDELHAKAAEIAAAKKLTDFDDFMDTKGLKSVGGRGGRGGRGGGRGRGRGRPRKSDE